MVVDITEGGGLVVARTACSLIRKGIEYMALKANILKINGAIFETFLAFAGILSAMAAYQLGDFTGFFVSSDARF